jgi:hypothetical protein
LRRAVAAEPGRGKVADKKLTAIAESNVNRLAA